ncbi:MAG: hypothetical protein JNL39_06555 [Opitutaceae bacterium]|nr:hypothetical protein [Opitutaceae bacterium]
MKRPPNTSFWSWFGFSPAACAIVLGMAAPTPLTAQDLAPASVVHMVYTVVVSDPLGNPNALAHAAVLQSDGVRRRINISLQEGDRPPATYSWTKTSANTATLRLTGAEVVSRLEMTFAAPGRGTYREIREGSSLVSSGDFLLAPVPRDSGPPLLNLSARVTLPAAQPAIQGFVVEGPASRRVLVRAIGPSLAQFGVANPVANPALTVFRGSTQIAANTGWGGAPSLAAVFSAVGAFALPAASRDSAVVLTLEPGNYTAHARADTAGEVLLEVYFVD